MKKQFDRSIIGVIIALIIFVAAMQGNFTVLGYQSLPSDINADGKVNILDLSLSATSFGSKTGDPRWNPSADLNRDGQINILDLTRIATNWGKTITLKVGLIVGGDESDLGFSMMAIKGAEAIATKYNWWTVTISKSVGYADQATVAASYGTNGYDAVFLVGGQYMSLAYDWDGTHIPKTYNNTLFVQIPGAGYSDQPNLVALGPGFQTVGHYLAGVLAAKMTKTGAVGWIVGAWYAPSYTCMECNAFIAGVHSVNSSIVVYSREVGGVNPWGDPSAGKTIAKALIDTYHVDIIVQVADFSGLGVISACQDAGSPYPMVIGTVGDQWSLAPNNTLTSVLMDTPRFMDTVVKSMIAGTFLGYKSIDIDLSALAPFHNLDPSVPSDVKTLLATTEAGIKAGTIVVPQDPTQPPDHSP